VDRKNEGNCEEVLEGSRSGIEERVWIGACRSHIWKVDPEVGNFAGKSLIHESRNG